jgi:hypothetical protein
MQRILKNRNLSCKIQVPVTCSAANALKLLDQIIEAARVVYMDEVFHAVSLIIDWLWIRILFTSTF